MVERVQDYDPEADEGMLNRAYVFAVKAHGSQKRASGDPYFSHPVEVAGLLTDLRLDHNRISTMPPCVMKLASLRRLDLDGNKLTALPADLGGLSNLQWLRLNGNRIPAAEKDRLRKALPNCHIVF